MNYTIIGHTDCPLVQIRLQRDETVRIERGCMAYMSDVELTGKMNTNKKGIGGMFSAIGRSLTSGESFFITEAQGRSDAGRLGIAPDAPLTIDNEHVVAWDASLDYSIRVASGTFGFTSGEGLVNEFHGQGTVYIQTRNIHSLADALRPFFPSSSSS